MKVPDRDRQGRYDVLHFFPWQWASAAVARGSRSIDTLWPLLGTGLSCFTETAYGYYFRCGGCVVGTVS